MESRMREIRTYGLMRGKSHRRERRGVGLYSTKKNHTVAVVADSTGVALVE